MGADKFVAAVVKVDPYAVDDLKRAVKLCEVLVQYV